MIIFHFSEVFKLKKVTLLAELQSPFSLCGEGLFQIKSNYKSVDLLKISHKPT